LAQVGDGFFGVAGVEGGEAEVVVGRGVVWVEAERLAQQCEAGFGFSLVEAADGEEVQGERVGLHAGECLLEVVGGLGEFVLFEEGEAAGEVAFGFWGAAAAGGDGEAEGKVQCWFHAISDKRFVGSYNRPRILQSK
jgi:hypothetical protein